MLFFEASRGRKTTERFYSERNAVSVSIHRSRKNNLTIVLFILEVERDLAHVSQRGDFSQLQLSESVKTLGDDKAVLKP